MKILDFYIYLSFCLILTSPVLAVVSDDNNYSYDKIKSTLLKDADVIVRDKNTSIEIKNDNYLIIDESIVITILNNRGMYASTLYFHYSAFSEVSYIEVEIYNRDGELVRKIKKDQIQDFSGTDPWTLFSSDRLKIIKATYANFPFTIKYSHKSKFNGYIVPPKWFAIGHSRTSIEKASLKIDVDYSSKLLYKDFNLPGCKIDHKTNSTFYSWDIIDFNALPREENIPDSMVIFPAVIYYTEGFQIEKINGKFSSWADFGNFYYRLNEDSDNLNEVAKKEIQSLTKDKKDIYGKIKTLYQWMQSQTRYVSVQQGIGGWKSFDANYVYKNKYGDCKALVNYMKAVLNVGGINSYPVLIYAGESKEYFNKETPYNYFNHVILTIPTENDTIWLECTNQKIPFNYLGSFTSNRYCLLIKEKDSKLICSPSYNSKINRSNLIGDILIASNGTSKCRINIYESGEMHDETSSVKFGASLKEKEDWLRNRIAITDYNFKSINFVETPKDSALSKIDIELESLSLIGVSGSRIFIHPKLVNGLIDNFPSDNSRHFPLEFYPEAEENNSITFHIPENFEPESLDKKEIISTEFAEYEYSLRYDNDSKNFILIDKFVLKKKIISPEKYNEWLEFRKKVTTLKNKTIVCKHI